MTVLNTNVQKSYAGNGLTTSFNTTFKVMRAEDIDVRLTDQNGNIYLLEQNLDYSISLLGIDAGSPVVFPLSSSTYPTLPTGWTIWLTRLTAFTQETDFVNQGPYLPENTEDQLDINTMQTQENNFLLQRAIRAAITDGPLSFLPNVANRALKYLGFDQFGNPQVFGSPSGTTAANLTTVGSMATLRTTAGTADQQNAVISGFYLNGDGGGGSFVWNALSTATDDGGTIIQVTGVPTGRWIRVWSGPLNVRWFGAKGDGATDDTTAVQAALTAAYAMGNQPRVYFPTGTFLVGKLVYKFQNLIGDGQTLTFIQGKPGQDVFYAPDPSISETGNIPAVPNSRQWDDLTVSTDSSGSPAFTRPIYPVKGAWSGGITVHVGQYYTNAGKVYVAYSIGALPGANSGVTGGSAPTHTIGVASDGGVNWLFVDSSQPNVENAALALPYYDGSVVSTPDVWINFTNVTFSDNQAGINNTCAIYCQRNMYNAHFINVRFKPFKFGLLVVPNTINWEDSQQTSDTMTLINVDFGGISGGGSYPCVIYNSQNILMNMIAMYVAHTNDKALYLLNVYDSRGSIAEPNSLVANNLYFEGAGGAGVQGMLIMGVGHVINVLNTTFAAGSYATLAATSCQVNQWNTSLGNNVIQVWGDHNELKGLIQQDPYTTVNDQGIGNIIESTFSTSVVNQTERSYSNANRRRRPVNEQGAAWILGGFEGSPFPNAEDLLIGGREAKWGSTLSAVVVDGTQETGGYVRLPSGGSFFTNAWSNVQVNWGQQLPACKGRLKVKIRSPAGNAGTLTVYSGATSLGSASITIGTSFAVFECDYDATGFSGALTCSIGSTAQTVDVAWVAFCPIPAYLLEGVIEMTPVTAPGTPATGHFVLYVDAGDSNKLKAKSGGGTVTTLALQ